MKAKLVRKRGFRFFGLIKLQVELRSFYSTCGGLCFSKWSKESGIPLTLNKLFRFLVGLVMIQVDHSIWKQSGFPIGENIAEFCNEMTMSIVEDFEGTAKGRKSENVNFIFKARAGPSVFGQVKESLFARKIRSSERQHFSASQSGIWIIVQLVRLFFNWVFIRKNLMICQVKVNFLFRFTIVFGSPLSCKEDSFCQLTEKTVESLFTIHYKNLNQNTSGPDLMTASLFICIFMRPGFNFSSLLAQSANALAVILWGQ